MAADKRFDEQALGDGDGREGRPALVAVDGTVYDVSASKRWRGGLHMRRHRAGADLSTDLAAAPHGAEVLQGFAAVGRYRPAPDAPESRVPPALDQLLTRVPMLRRHPHPMTVHFPIVCLLFAPLFTLLALVTGERGFETTGLHCLAAGVAFCLVAMGTGWLTWWLNYLARPLRPVRIKLRLTPLLLATALAALIWRLNDPLVLGDGRLDLPALLYLLLLLALIPLIVVIGWFGASMTFPVEKQ